MFHRPPYSARDAARFGLIVTRSGFEVLSAPLRVLLEASAQLAPGLLAFDDSAKDAGRRARARLGVELRDTSDRRIPEVDERMSRPVGVRSGGRNDRVHTRPLREAFVRESEMTAPAIAAAPSWWASRAPLDFIATEVVGHDAIADLAAVRFDQAALARRAAAGIEPLVDRLALLAVLGARRRSLTVAQLAETLRVTPSGARRAVQVAANAGALVRGEDRKWSAHRDWRPATKRVVAVELKLRGSQRAIEQAEAYLRWADEAWIVLARPPSARAEAAALARGINVGVLAPNGTLIDWVRGRAARGSQDWTRAWAGEQVAARALASGSRPSPTWDPLRARRATPAGGLAPAGW